MALVTLASTLAACHAPVRPEPIRHGIERSYELNVRKSTPTGDEMVTVADGRSLPVFELKGILHGPRLQAPEGLWIANLAYTGDCGGGSGRYVVTRPEYYHGAVGFILTENGQLACEEAALDIRAKRNGRSWVAQAGAGTRFERRRFALTDRGFKMELLYSGMDGQSVFMIYREYVDDLARPAYSQDLRYQIEGRNGTSMRIQFRQFGIEILNASNAGIEFIVFQH